MSNSAGERAGREKRREKGSRAQSEDCIGGPPGQTKEGDGSRDGQTMGGERGGRRGRRAGRSGGGGCKARARVRQERRETMARRPRWTRRLLW